MLIPIISLFTSRTTAFPADVILSVNTYGMGESLIFELSSEKFDINVNEGKVSVRLRRHVELHELMELRDVLDKFIAEQEYKKKIEDDL